MKTAEEFIKEGNEGYSLRTVIDNLTDEQIIEVMADFCKYHVKEALESAAEKAETEYEPHWSGEQEGSTYINRDSILNAYNLEDIK